MGSHFNFERHEIWHKFPFYREWILSLHFLQNYYLKSLKTKFPFYREWMCSFFCQNSHFIEFPFYREHPVDWKGLASFGSDEKSSPIHQNAQISTRIYRVTFHVIHKTRTRINYPAFSNRQTGFVPNGSLLPEAQTQIRMIALCKALCRILLPIAN